MLFNSYIFFLFGILFFLFWPLTSKNKNFRYAYIVLASFVFYGWWDWRFLFLIIGSGIIDFFTGLLLHRRNSNKIFLLILSLLGNLGSLAIFKYSFFFAINLDYILNLIGLRFDLVNNIPSFALILPVGISFYTFQSMSYTIDIYKGNLSPTKNILHFFAYLSMFPQLVAGPIVRASDILNQLETFKFPTESERWEGLKLIVYGFFKKVVIADNLGPFVNNSFGQNLQIDSTIFWWVVVTAFAIQIYGDFSGYSDIARGIAKWMGYDFKLNFNHPYTAISIKDFWSRWHISLSTWFKDYVYIPLGGSRIGYLKSHTNMWITMVISGLWHGAAWTFIIWGALHALFLSFERISKLPERIMKIPGGRLWASILVLIQVWIAWVFFRAESLDQALQIIHTMFSFNLVFTNLNIPISLVLFVFIMFLRETYIAINFDLERILPKKIIHYLSPIGLAILAVASVYLRGEGNAFIYFQF